MEPYRLKRWKLTNSLKFGIFYTCARPGRSKGSSKNIPDSILHEWVSNLPRKGSAILISLLGQKPTGKSEWSFYSFYAKGCSFQHWLDKHYADRSIEVIEHPTCDLRPIQKTVLDAVADDIRNSLAQDHIVILFDSGGIVRVNCVCKYIGAKALNPSPIVRSGRP